MDVLRTCEGVVAISGGALLALGLIGNMESLTVPGAVMVGAAIAFEGLLALLRKSNINPPGSGPGLP